MNRLSLALCLSLLPALVSCGGESDLVGPIASGPMELSLVGIDPSDIEDGMIDRTVSIATAAANLWPSYVALVTDLCGRTPVGFSIGSIAVALNLEESVNVTQLEDVLGGTVTMYLTGGGVTVDIGTGVLSGVGPMGLEEVSTQQSLAALHSLMLASDFRVGLRGDASWDEGTNFRMDLDLSFLTRAYCQ